MADDSSAALTAEVAAIVSSLGDANAAREVALPACRRVIRASGSSIRAVHLGDADRAATLADEAEAALREAQRAVDPFPAVAHAGFLHDAEKEYVEARATAALVAGRVVAGPAVMAVEPSAWLKGVAEAASELRRHTLDVLRAGDLAEGERLLSAMDDVYAALVTVDLPDALTGGLRRTLDALRAVLERTRGDVTITAVQVRLQRALEAHAARTGEGGAPAP